jgi:hypothetical protein
LDHIYLFVLVPELIEESHVANILDFYKANVEVHESLYAFTFLSSHVVDEYRKSDGFQLDVRVDKIGLPFLRHCSKNDVLNFCDCQNNCSFWNTPMIMTFS